MKTKLLVVLSIILFSILQDTTITNQKPLYLKLKTSLKEELINTKEVRTINGKWG